MIYSLTISHMHITYLDPPVLSLWIHDFPSGPPISCHLCVIHCVEGFFTGAWATYQQLHHWRRISLAWQPLTMSIIREGQVFKALPLHDGKTGSWHRPWAGGHGGSSSWVQRPWSCPEENMSQHPSPCWPQHVFQLLSVNLVLCTLLCKGIWLHRYCWFRNFELMACDIILYTLFKHTCSFCVGHSTVLYEQHLNYCA